ncbi:serine hydrolase domain-containing protein [Pantoea coffeiphila]|uniref:serine hydrolase domain-containing protein n=1 Tax=Pantoea coffeiphila TaxID=1465635 RepID=UPI001EF972FE|nr:serine hydrolase [Pantoea coffeiphila]MBM7342680.1 CubicO group peptidase (beta-lactamase class C family) [Pantoea coffeiphila]
MKKNIVMAIPLALMSLALMTGNGSAEDSACEVDGLTRAPQPCDKLLPNVKNMLTWNQQQRTVGFRNDYRNYPGDRFRHGDNIYPLLRQEKQLMDITYQYQGKVHHYKDYVKNQDLQALLIIKDGRVVLEKYYHGNTPTTLWTSRSVGKSIVSTLVGIAIKQGKIHSLDDQITRYEPDFKGTAWDGVTLKQLIQHTSGVTWNENYADPHSDFSTLTQCEAKSGTYDCVYNLVHGLKRDPSIKPGEVWSYNTGGAWLLGDVLEKATGKTIAQNLQDSIWMPFGMASDGIWHAYEKDKHDMGGHGFNATLEDWGRFGLYILGNGFLPDGSATLPEHWLEEATNWTKAKNSVSAGYPEGVYGYEWWNHNVPVNAENVAPKGDGNPKEGMWAMGIYGQLIAINKNENLVMVQWSTWEDAEPAADRQPLENSVFFNAVAEALKKP